MNTKFVGVSIGLLLLVVPFAASAQTQTISIIQEQIQALLSRLAGQQQSRGFSSTPIPVPTPPSIPIAPLESDDYPGVTPPPNACPNLFITIQRGARDIMTGGQVSELQIYLADYFDLNEEDVVTGYFGKLTQKYVIEFQKKHGLPAYGIVGSMTRAKIKEVCGGGETPKVEASISVSTDPSSPAFAVVPAGVSGVTLGVYKFRINGDSGDIRKVGLKLTSGSPQSLASVELWRGNTRVGNAVFAGSNTTAVAITDIGSMERDTDVALTVKGDIARIGVGQPGISGETIRVNVNPSVTQGVLYTTGSTAIANGSTDVAGVRIFRSLPHVTMKSLSSPVAVNGSNALLRFAISAHPPGDISIGKLTIKTEAMNASVGAVDVYAYTDSDFSSPVPGRSSPHLGGAQMPISTGGSLNVVLENPLLIPAGGTYYFEVRGQLSGVTSASVVATTLEHDKYAAPMFALSGNEAAYSAFVWSPNSQRTSSPSDVDWVNGHAIPELSTTGIGVKLSSGTDSSARATYKAYLGDSTYPNITTQNITEEDALANCKLNAADNPSSYIRCTWGDKEIFNNKPNVSLATLNPNDKGTQIVLSNGDLTVSASAQVSAHNAVRAKYGMLNGMSSTKFYWEVFVSNGSASQGNVNTLGVTSGDASLQGPLPGNGGFVWGYGTDYGLFYSAGFTANPSFPKDVSGLPSAPPLSNGWKRFAYDAGTGSLWIGDSTGWFGGGDPVAGTSPTAIAQSPKKMYPAASLYNANSSIGFAFNFGQTPFQYAPPTGFEMLRFTIPKFEEASLRKSNLANAFSILAETLKGFFGRRAQ